MGRAGAVHLIVGGLKLVGSSPEKVMESHGTDPNSSEYPPMQEGMACWLILTSSMPNQSKFLHSKLQPDLVHNLQNATAAVRKAYLNR